MKFATLLVLGTLFIGGCCHNGGKECIDFTADHLADPSMYDSRLDYDNDGVLTTIDYGHWLKECEGV